MKAKICPCVFLCHRLWRMRRAARFISGRRRATVPHLHGFNLVSPWRLARHFFFGRIEYIGAFDALCDLDRQNVGQGRLVTRPCLSVATTAQVQRAAHFFPPVHAGTIGQGANCGIAFNWLAVQLALEVTRRVELRHAPWRAIAGNTIQATLLCVTKPFSRHFLAR